MKNRFGFAFRLALLVTLIITLTIASTRSRADTGMCGGVTVTLPFTDVAGNPFFCQIAAAYFSGLTFGTSATTFSPTATVTREQMAAFITRTQDSVLRRSSPRTVTGQLWTSNPQYELGWGLTTVGLTALGVAFDGADVWVTSRDSNLVSRVRASDGRLLESWTGVNGAESILVARGRVFVLGYTSPVALYMIDPTQSPGSHSTVLTLPGLGGQMAFDGSKFWVTHGSNISIVTPTASLPWTATTVNNGITNPGEVIFDGSNIWITDVVARTISKLNNSGNVIQTVNVGTLPVGMVFDGTNIWLACLGSNDVYVIRASTGAVVSVLTGNGLDQPLGVGFDGERVLVTCPTPNKVCLWKATDLTPLGSHTFTVQARPFKVCSDGLNFWIALSNAGNMQGKLARF